MRTPHPEVEFRCAGHVSTAVRAITHCFSSFVDIIMLVKLVLFAVLGLSFSFFFNMGFLVTLAALFGVYLATGGWKFTRIVLLTLPRDIRGLYYLVRVKLMIRRNNATNRTVPKLFDETVSKYPKKPCILFADETWTYEDVQAYTHQVANFLHNAGYKKGDVIALYMENCPQFIGLWLGMSKVGVIAAFINFNLRDVSLVHCIKVANAKAVIFGTSLLDALNNVHPSLPGSTIYYCLGAAKSNVFPAIDLIQEIERSPSYAPPTADCKCSEPLFYVYTSGTTGMPKAALISHTRFCVMACGIKLFLKLGPADTLYIPLPLYHTAGGILGVGQAILGGTTLAIRPKFSASQFWLDCAKYNCTSAQYIGEICRYLLSQPYRREERHHSVRVMFGNGVKPQIWVRFQKRFGVQVIGEFYGATEGNCSIVNFENKVGAVGFTTRIAPFLYPITLVKVDPHSTEIIRDSNGVCVMAKPGEPGLMMGKIIKGDPVREFDGYMDDAATNKKIVKDVFRKGDMAFSTGDILVMDELGYMYFRDRSGDTFRWRGENVSTNEVEAVISNIVKLKDAVVYGVEVPDNEGRAGMAAIVDEDDSIDVTLLGEALARSLPAYARPVFIRFIKEADTTGTFKLKKTTLRDEGFNVLTLSDKIFYANVQTKQFELLTADVYKDIMAGKIRL